MVKDEKLYRVTMADENEDTVSRLLNMAGLPQYHAKDICRRNGVDLFLDQKQADKLKDLGFALYLVITK